MRCPAHLLLLVLILSSTAYAQKTGDCKVVVSENGRCLVLLSLEGAGSLEVPLPLDVPFPEVEGAIYVQSQEGVEVSLAEGDNAVLAYKSSLLTSKEGEKWVFTYTTPPMDSLELTVSLPKNIKITSLVPSGAVSSTDKSTDIRWGSAGGKEVRIEYEYTDDEPVTTHRRQASGASFLEEYLTTLLTIVVAAVLLMVLYSKKRRGQTAKTLVVQTPGKKAVMDSLSWNENQVVKLLLSKGGSMRRTDLAKATGLAKSSLAAVVNNLEKKQVIDVDKRYTVHTINLTDSFKRL